MKKRLRWRQVELIWVWQRDAYERRGCREFEYLPGVKGWFFMLAYFP